MSRDRDCRVYVGNLPRDIAEYELADLFDRWRPIRDISIKSRMGSQAFAFVTFDHPDDASDAVHYKDGVNFAGGRIRVELVKGPAGGDRGKDRGSGATRRGDYRVLVSGMPKSGSWQDLKDHMREAGDVVFTDINRDGTGVVEFSSSSDMKYALDKMQNTIMRSRSGETGEVRIKEDIDDSRDGGRGYDRDDRRDSPPPRRSDDRRDGSPPPRRGGDSPRRGGDSPRRGGDSPRRGGDSPRRGGDSPRRGGDSPRRDDDDAGRDRDRDSRRDDDKERD